MKILSAIIFFIMVVFADPINAQTYKQQFNGFGAKNDTLAQKLLLEKWEKENPNDPELFVANYNYYVKKSMQEIITLGDNPTGENALQIVDPDSTKTDPVGFIYGETYYNPIHLNKGYDYINKGIEKHPSRLDMRFGKIYIFGETGDYDNFTKEIIKTIDYSVVINNKWTWSDSELLESGLDFMLSSIQEYQVQLYNTENDDLLINMKQIAETVLKYYPDHIESLSNLSVVYLIQEQFDSALAVLLKAEKINPTDFIVMLNIAQAYKLKADNPNAIKYYEIVLLHGDEDAKQYAKSQIEELKKK